MALVAAALVKGARDPVGWRRLVGLVLKPNRGHNPQLGLFWPSVRHSKACPPCFGVLEPSKNALSSEWGLHTPRFETLGAFWPSGAALQGLPPPCFGVLRPSKNALSSEWGLHTPRFETLGAFWPSGAALQGLNSLVLGFLGSSKNALSSKWGLHTPCFGVLGAFWPFSAAPLQVNYIT